MGAIAVFTVPGWRARYPEFSTVLDDTVLACFAETAAYHSNDGTGPIADVNIQLIALNQLTAHIVALSFGTDTSTPAQLVGRITSAGIGSVNVSTAPLAATSSAQGDWARQTLLHPAGQS